MRAFYEKGLSIDEVADRFGLPYSTVRRQLLRQKATLRTRKSVSFSINQRQSFKNSAAPPYGLGNGTIRI
ncbi:MAG: sigma-70 family RNA polymerase sigma factor [Deltaproteobacteria bacterium]|nr:sigma-70 family RNA polymerase sigma factor [Deltaproteobacteria bacterium]